MPFDLNQLTWSVIGSTQEYHNLKEDISLVCRDVTEAACIREICLMDILHTFKIHGYVVMPIEAKKVVEAAEAWADDDEIPDEHVWDDYDQGLFGSIRKLQSWGHDEEVNLENCKEGNDD